MASIRSTACTSYCPAPGRRHPVDHHPAPRWRRRRAARGRRSGQHHVDGVHKLLHGAWPAPPRSCSGSPAGSSPAPPARCARSPRWPAPRRPRAPAAARRLTGATLFLQRLTGRILAGAAGAPRAAAAVANTTSTAYTSFWPAPGRRHLVPGADHGRDHAGAAGAPRAVAAVANTTSTACTSCCTAPGWRHHVPAADHRPGPGQRRRRAARGGRSGQHHVDGVHKLLHGA